MIGIELIYIRTTRVNKPELNIRYGHDAISYLYDIDYIPRIMRKIAKDLNKNRRDIDRVQNGIESFLILNSRFYQDLIIDLVKNVRSYHTIPNDFSVKSVIAEFSDRLSVTYHSEAPSRRHRVAHGSNFNVVGVPEYKNQTLPKPMRFKPTHKPPLFNMASRKQLIKMWQRDILECAQNIDDITRKVIEELNRYEGLPEIDVLPDRVLREGKTMDEYMVDIEKTLKDYSKMKAMKYMSEADILKLQIEHFEKIEELEGRYFTDY